MRIPTIVAAATALTLGLGGTLAIGLTAAAEPPPSWIVNITSDPLYPADELTFSGTKPSASVPTDVTVTSGDATASASCLGLDTDAFSCSYDDPELDLAVGLGTITFLIGEGADFTLDFTVSPEPATGPPGVNFPTMIPAGIIVSASPTYPATMIATTLSRYNGASWDAIDAGCGFTDADPACTVEGLSPGIYQFSVQQDKGDGVTGVGEFASRYFVIPAEPTIEAVALPGNVVELSGTFSPDPAMPLSSSIVIPSECTSSTVDNGNHTWECTTDPLTPGSHSFAAVAQADGDTDNYDAGGDAPQYVAFGLSAEVSASVTVGVPLVQYSDFVPGGVTITGSPLSPATYVAIGVDDADWGSTAALCPEEVGEIAPFNQAGDISCAVSGLGSGTYYSYAQQDDGYGQPTDVFAYDYFTVPETPYIDQLTPNSDGTVTLEGWADRPFSVSVLHGDSNAPISCDVTLTYHDYGWYSYYTWECTTTETFEVGDYTFAVYATDAPADVLEDSPGYYGELSDAGMTYHPGGISPISYIDFPVVNYGPIPGGIDVNAFRTGAASAVRVDLFSLEQDEGSYWAWRDSCAGDSLDEYYSYYGYSGYVFEGIDSYPADPTHNFGCQFSDVQETSDSHVWAIGALQDSPDPESGYYYLPDYYDTYDYFYLPDAPIIDDATAHASGTVTVEGTGEPGFLVQVIDASDHILCSVYPSAEDNDSYGIWSCDTPKLASGSHVFRAYAEDTEESQAGDQDFEYSCECAIPSYQWGGLSTISDPQSATVAFVLPPAGGSTPPESPANPPALIVPNWVFTLGGVDLNNLHPGDKFTMRGTGLPPGSTISAELHSTPMSLGTATVGSDGTFALSATVPEDVEPGDHTIVVSVSGPGIQTSTKEQPVKVTAESETAGHSAEGSGTAETAHGEADAHGGAEGELSATAPNILTNSMNPIIEVLNDPGRIPAAFAAGLVLIIFAILPAHLLNSTIAEQYERFARRVPALRTAPKWYTSLSAAIAKAPALGGVLLMAATGFLFAFADPKFGFNLHSLRLIIALSAALFVVFFVANWITATIMRRVWNVDVVVRLRPLGLILTVVGVIVSRILDFSPGFLVGVVLGLSIASTAAAEHAWKAVLIRASVVTAFGIGSWMIYSSIAEGVHHDPTFLNEVVLEFFVAIATEGIVLLLVELLPLHMLEGERLYKKSKVLWGAVYTVVLVVFILAVVPWEGNWRELGQSFWPWFTAVAIFGAVCVAIYLYFRFIAEPLHHDEHHDGSGPELEDDERIAVGNDR